MKIEKIKKKFTDIGVKMAGKGFKVTQVPEKIYVGEFDGGLYSFNTKKELEVALSDDINRGYSAHLEETTNDCENEDNAVVAQYDLKVTLVKRKK